MKTYVITEAAIREAVEAAATELFPTFTDNSESFIKPAREQFVSTVMDKIEIRSNYT